MDGQDVPPPGTSKSHHDSVAEGNGSQHSRGTVEIHPSVDPRTSNSSGESTDEEEQLGGLQLEPTRPAATQANSESFSQVRSGSRASSSAGHAPRDSHAESLEEHGGSRRSEELHRRLLLTGSRARLAASELMENWRQENSLSQGRQARSVQVDNLSQQQRDPHVAASLRSLTDRDLRTLADFRIQHAAEETSSRQSQRRREVSEAERMAVRMAEVSEEPHEVEDIHKLFRTVMAARSSAKTAARTNIQLIENMCKAEQTDVPTNSAICQMFKDRAAKLSYYMEKWEELKDRAIEMAPHDDYYKTQLKKLSAWMGNEISDFTIADTRASVLIAECRRRIALFETPPSEITLDNMEERIEQGFARVAAKAAAAATAAARTEALKRERERAELEYRRENIIAATTAAAAVAERLPQQPVYDDEGSSNAQLSYWQQNCFDDPATDQQLTVAEIAQQNRAAGLHAENPTEDNPFPDYKRVEGLLSRGRGGKFGNQVPSIQSFLPGLDENMKDPARVAKYQSTPARPLRPEAVGRHDEADTRNDIRCNPRQANPGAGVIGSEMLATERFNHFHDNQTLKGKVSELQRQLVESDALLREMCDRNDQEVTQDPPGDSRPLGFPGTPSPQGGAPVQTGKDPGDIPDWLNTALSSVFAKKPNASGQTAGGSKVKLPQLTLTHFAGDVTLFPAFWDNFYSLVASNDTLDIYYKHNLLVQCLDKNSKAREAVQAMIDKPKMYEAMIEHLKYSFGDRRLLLSALIRKVLNRSQVTLKEAPELLNFLVASVIQLREHKVDVDNQGTNILLLSVFESKMPDEIGVAWEQEIRKRLRKKGLIKPALEDAAPPIKVQFTIDKYLEFVFDYLKANDSQKFIHRDDKNGKGNNQPNSGGQQQNQNKSSGQQQPSQRSTTQDSKSTMGGGQSYATGQDRGKKWKKNLSAFIQSCEDGEDLSALLQGNPGDKKTSGGSGNKKTGAGQGGSPPKGALPAAQKQKNPVQDGFKTGCLWCGEKHHPLKCKKVETIPVLERWALMRQRMRQEMICVSCFENGHKSTDCSKGCEVKGCLRRHATILHIDYPAGAGH